MKRLLLGLLLLQNAISNPPPNAGGTVLAKRTGVNFNSTADQTIAMGSGAYQLRRILVTNASISLTTAAGGVYTAASKGGTVLVPATQAYSLLTSSTKTIDLALSNDAVDARMTVGTLYFALTTAQGATATADVYIIGDRLQ